MAASLLCVLMCISLPAVCTGNAFLERIDSLGASEDGVSEEEVRASLLEEIETALGTNVTKTRIGRLEEILRPMFVALPKNPQGYLDHGTVRYALHRLFVQLHGWHITGLSSAGSSWNSSSPTNVLKDRVPGYIQDLFEERLGGRGMGLVELAVLASTLEHLIHSEVMGRLEASYKKLNMSTLETTNAKETDELINTYMLSFILGKNLTAMNQRMFLNLRSRIRKVYPFWDETLVWVRGVMDEVLQSVNTASGAVEPMVDFATVTRIAEVIGERYGMFQDASECHQIKAELLKLNDRNTGRVLLTDFYRQAVDGTNWQFSENRDYLRQLGVLDESDPSAARVIVPNYVGGSSNCIASSSFYSVCCFDECEGLLGHLEHHIAAPDADPSRIADLVAMMHSSTVSAPRTLPAELLRRLQEVADTHGGTVPLHGRLFSQWLHHAFPRECPYPHVSDTVSPVTPGEWKANTGRLVKSTKAEMESHIEELTIAKNAAGVDWEKNLTSFDSMMWTAEEELLVIRPTLPPQTGTIWQLGRNGMLFAAFASVMVGLMKNGQNCLGLTDKRFMSSEKVFV